MLARRVTISTTGVYLYVYVGARPLRRAAIRIETEDGESSFASDELFRRGGTEVQVQENRKGMAVEIFNLCENKHRGLIRVYLCGAHVLRHNCSRVYLPSATCVYVSFQIV